MTETQGGEAQHYVRGLIFDDDGRLLLIRRTRQTGERVWSAPGGAVDATDKTAQDALRRILSVGFGVTVGPVEWEFRCRNGNRVESDFVARLIELNVDALRAGTELTNSVPGTVDLCFVSRGELPNLDLKGFLPSGRGTTSVSFDFPGAAS